ncbi:hypothetical protein BJB45_12985 [Halomonas huangheensis]|uniref:histidine kinase n=1 Tax=Halomonas huangheensis TaxID=1178482 RepID=W1N9G0_9GAMM|nr:hypothetical protein AR456_14145 [Halomonas huangheensis]ERL51565.1 hypothetical protein BJB45_12985 [Halomonas huangheensis]
MATVAAVLFMLALMVAGGLIYDRHRSLSHRSIDTVTWTLYQFDRSIRDLRMSIWERGEDNLDDTLLDFELLYGRLRGLQEGQAAAFLQDFSETATRVGRIEASMTSLDTMFSALASGTASYDPEMRRKIGDTLKVLQEHSRQLMLVHGRISAETRSRDIGWLTRLYGVALVSMLLILATGVWLIQSLIRESRARDSKRRLLESQSETLREAFERAESASEAKSNFMAIMSHEIRTPLSGVLGMADLLCDEELTEEGRRQLKGLKESAIGLRAVINDILDYTRIESGHLEIHQGTFDFAGMLEHLATAYRAHGQSNVQFLMRAAPDLPDSVVGDLYRLRQVLLNLLDNAFKFTDHGVVMLRVARLSGDRVSFVVVDTGCGIEPEDTTAIFEPFAQSDTTLARRHGGSGLGLAICARLVKAMGGQLQVDSQPGSGSRFWFDIELPSQPSSAGSDVGEGEHINPGPHHVLVVEDNELNRELIAAMLVRLGQSCELVANGGQALQALGERHFDLVLMDMQMPVMDGLETTRRWRQCEAQANIEDPRWHALPVVALTANVMPEHRRACLEAGMDEVIGKPFSRAELSDVLARYPARAALESSRGNVYQFSAGSNKPVSAPLLAAIPQPEVDTELLVEDTLCELREVMSPDGVQRLMTTYLQRFPERLSRLRVALLSDDTAGVEAEAHELRGVSSSLGFRAIESVAAELEGAAAQGNTRDALEALLVRLEVLGPASGKALRDAGILGG